MTLINPGVGWTPLTPETIPPEGVLLDTITPGGDERQMIFEKNLFWLPNRRMYLYFSPSFWRPASNE